MSARNARRCPASPTGSSERTHGVPAVIAQFRAQTDQTIVQGYAGFLRHDGRTYQLVAYAPQNVFAGHEGEFERVIASFAPVTDRAILDVEPRRLDIVRLDSSMSLAEFARRQDANLPLERLALINQIDDPRAPIAAGTLVERGEGSGREYLSATER
jgi:predicted Zn-dependent protease